MGHSRKRQAQSLLEVLIASIFLAAGGMAIYSASQRSVSEAAWGAERVMAEGLLNDLVTTFQTYPYGDLQAQEDGVTLMAGTVDQTIQSMPQANIDALNNVLSLSDASFLDKATLSGPNTLPGLVPANPNYAPYLAAASATAKTDVIGKEYNTMVNLLGLKRMVIFQDNGGGTGVVHCIIQWTSRAGPKIDVRRRFLVSS